MTDVRLFLVAGLLMGGLVSADERPSPPTRSHTDPGAPPFTVLKGDGTKLPVNAEGNFVIGPDYPAPAIAEAPQGKLQQFTMDSKDSQFYPGVGRDVSGTVDPDNPKTLIVQTHPQPYQRTITVYIPKQYKT